MKGRISANAGRFGLCVIFSVYLAVGHCEENGFATPRSFLANVSADCLVRPSTALDAFFFVSNLTPAILSSSEAP